MGRELEKIRIERRCADLLRPMCHDVESCLEVIELGTFADCCECSAAAAAAASNRRRADGELAQSEDDERVGRLRMGALRA
eukprot:6203193-Pleurochrysis_carterae.AAC.4